jgi:ribokinase
MKNNRIVVVGSANIDITVYAPRLPNKGETIVGDSYTIGPGGKGANQAVAAARLGGNVSLVARIGKDNYGDTLIASLQKAAVDISHVVRDEKSLTGVAQITVASESGENTIVVAQGSNKNFSPSDILAAEDLIASAQTLICSLEIPFKTVETALMLAHRYDVRSIVNPAPAQRIPSAVLKQISVLTPNQHEVAVVAGDLDCNPIVAAQTLLQEGAETVIVTMGAEGAVFFTAGEPGTPVAVPSFPVKNVVDTTGAGDCYSGALAVALTEGRTIAEAMAFAAHAAAISVTRKGAISSMPNRAELD